MVNSSIYVREVDHVGHKRVDSSCIDEQLTEDRSPEKVVDQTL